MPSSETPVLDQPSIAQLQGHSLASLVQGEVERLILGGELPAGTKLAEATLAERLGVSRGPLREAFRMLEEAGLVRTEKNRGVFVREIPIHEVMEIFELRAVMDEFVGRKLATTINTTQLRELRALVEAMDRSAKQGLADDFHLQNLRFHDRLLELTNNTKLVTTYRKLIKELSLFRRLNLTAESMALYAREHRQIVKAIASGDPAAAGQAMAQHVHNSQQRTLEKHRQGQAAVAATPAPDPSPSAAPAAAQPAPRRRRKPAP